MGTVSGRMLRAIDGKEGDFESVLFSPDGKRIIASQRIVTMKENDAPDVKRPLGMWDAATGEKLPFPCATGDSTPIAFSNDGRRVAVAATRESVGDIVSVCDAIDGRSVLELRGHEDYIYGVRFSADGTRIVTSSQDHTVRLWDVATGQLIEILYNFEGRPDAVFTPDSKHVITMTDNDEQDNVRMHEVRIWDINSVPHGNLFQIACANLHNAVDLTDIAKEYGMTGLTNICESDPPVPDFPLH
jgi:WD40 repeat protein